MIRINLLGEEIKQDNGAFVWVGGYLGSLLLFLVVFAFLYTSVSSRVAELTTETQDLERQLVQIKKTTKEVRDLENKRKELNEKLAVIAKLKKSKLGPVRVLDDLNISIPDRAWVTDVREKSNLLNIAGFALDNQTIANFMRELDKSNFFSSIELIETKQAMRDKVKIKSFVLQVKVNYTGINASKEQEDEEQKSS